MGPAGGWSGRDGTPRVRRQVREEAHDGLPREAARAPAGPRRYPRHHLPRRANIASPALDAVHIANAVAKTIGTGLGVEGMNMQVETASVEALGLTLHSLEALCAQTMMELPRTLELFEDVHSGVQHTHR